MAATWLTGLMLEAGLATWILTGSSTSLPTAQHPQGRVPILPVPGGHTSHAGVGFPTWLAAAGEAGWQDGTLRGPCVCPTQGFLGVNYSHDV